MADQRPFSRFRLPWLSTAVAAPPPPRPAAEPQPPRPAVETIQAPPQPTQRPPFRPAGIAPVLSPSPQPQAPQRTEPQPPSPPRATTIQPTSPSRATTETRAASVPPSPSRVTSQPVSPSRATSEARVASTSRTATQPRAASVPPSPTRNTSQPRPTQQTDPQPQSPSRSASRLTGQTSSQPSSPSRKATQVQPTVSQPISPPKKLQPTIQETSQPSLISTQPPPSTSQQEKPKPASLSFSQTAEPRKSLSEPTDKVKATEEEKQVMEKLKSEGKTSGPAKEEPLKSAITELLAASGAGSQAKERQQEKEDKKTTTISSNGEYIKTVSSTHPKARNKLTESHQKSRMSNGEQVSLQKEIRDDIFKFVHKLGVGQLKYPADEKPVNIVTIAGENRGASMHVGSEPARKDGSIHIHRGYKLNPDDSTGATTDGEGSKESRKLKTKEDPVKKAYVNSNAQSINNSMVFDSSVNERNPGVQLVLSENLAEPTKPSAKPESLETYKAEFNVTPAQKLTYEPTIRRRCLRGLFLESSDSDPENPEKPRRHGCRYDCGEKSKDKDIGVL